MKKYLIVKCKPLGDQFECDVNRTPLCMVNDYKTFEADYDFEVYELGADDGFSLVKEYDDYAGNEGMGLFSIDESAESDDEIVTIKKFPGLSRHSKLPKEVQRLVNKWKDDESFDNALENCGDIQWNDNGCIVWYGEYSGPHIYPCW